MMLAGAVTLLLTLLCVDCTLITNHLIEIDHYGRKVSMDVTRDKERNTVLTVIGDVSMYKNGRPSVNLHDFNTNYGVLKDINKKVCFLAKSLLKKPPTEDEYEVGVTYHVDHHNLVINKEKMSQEEVWEIAGPNIAAFCADYTTYFATAIPIEEGQQEAKLSAAQSTYWCVFSSCKADNL